MNRDKLIETLYLILALYVVLPKLRLIWKYLQTTFLYKGGNLLNKFQSTKSNEKPWVIITGCTAGIGE